jgi:hypothetical protein
LYIVFPEGSLSDRRRYDSRFGLIKRGVDQNVPH